MPSVSRSQQRYMGQAYDRAAQGKPRSTDPKMPLGALKSFQKLARPSVPERSYGSKPVTEQT